MITETPLESNGLPSTDGGQPSFQTIQLNEVQFRAFLLNLSKQTGSMAELSRQLDITGQFLGDVISGRKHAGPKLLSKLGIKAETVYTISFGEPDNAE